MCTAIKCILLAHLIQMKDPELVTEYFTRLNSGFELSIPLIHLGKFTIAFFLDVFSLLNKLNNRPYNVTVSEFPTVL